jgi:hypothetical protein
MKGASRGAFRGKVRTAAEAILTVGAKTARPPERRRAEHDEEQEERRRLAGWGHPLAALASYDTAMVS